MKKKLVTLLALLSSVTQVQAFEAGQFSLETPSTLVQDEAAFTIRHRFFGDVSKSEDFFGIDDGGNVMLQLRYAPIDNLLVEVHHTRESKEYNVAVGYSYDFDFIKAGYTVNAFSLELPQFQDRQNSYFGNLSFQSPNYFDHVIFTANLGYDGYYENTGAGVGADINVANFFTDLTFTERISIMGEYYPQVTDVAGVSGKYDSFAAGVKFQTYAHHFEILVTNSVGMDARTMMLGTNSNVLHFGFNINRKF
jgi:hypothetical protein